MDLNLIFHAFLISIIISLIELFFIHKDEGEFGFRIWFTHGIHTFPFTLIMVSIAMLSWYSFPIIQAYLPIPLHPGLVILLVFLISGIKIHGISMLAKGFGEKWIHCWIIAALIAGAPFYYPFISPLLPRIF